MTCGIWASIGLVKSCTISAMSWARAQQSERIAPVCVLHVFSATPVQPSDWPSFTNRQLWALSSMKSGFRCGNAAHVDPLLLQIVGERLFDVQNHVEDCGSSRSSRSRISFTYAGSRTVQLKSAESHFTPLRSAHLADADEAVVVPSGIIAAKFYFQAIQPVALDPIAEQHGIAVVRLMPFELAGFERIEPADQMPHGQIAGRFGRQEIGRI